MAVAPPTIDGNLHKQEVRSLLLVQRSMQEVRSLLLVQGQYRLAMFTVSFRFSLYMTDDGDADVRYDHTY